VRAKSTFEEVWVAWNSLAEWHLRSLVPGTLRAGVAMRVAEFQRLEAELLRSHGWTPAEFHRESVGR